MLKAQLDRDRIERALKTCSTSAQLKARLGAPLTSIRRAAKRYGIEIEAIEGRIYTRQREKAEAE